MARKPGERMLRVGIVLLIVGVALGIGPAIVVGTRGASTLLDTLHAPTVRTPGTARLELGAHRYLVFERTGSTKRVGAGGISFTSTRNDYPVLQPSEVQVTSPTGRPVEVRFYRGSETITKGSTIYTASLAFTVPAADRYRVRVRSTDTGEILVTRGLADGFRDLLGWIALGAVAGVVLLAGIVLAAVGGFRRSRET